MICVSSGTRSGLSPAPLAQVLVQTKILCSRLSNSSAAASSCTINTTQLALLQPQNQPELVYFEATVVFNSYPWPEWESLADANGSVTVDGGEPAVCIACIADWLS